MFIALVRRFGMVRGVTKSCSAKDISADVIIFYDIHSAHHIEIDGIEKHKAIKYEYFNDPHQKFCVAKHENGLKVLKLGPKQRTKRAMGRGIDFIICPYREGYYKYIAPHLDRADERFVWFPPVPKNRNAVCKKRVSRILACGDLWRGEAGFNPYEFRIWGYQRPNASYCSYKLSDTTRLPCGEKFQQFLSCFAGALALCDVYTVPKYFEIPLAGCVCFMQHVSECDDLGFKDGENCIFVDRSNFDDVTTHFLNNIEDYQHIADAGKKLVKDNWTAKHFADFIYNHARKRLNVAT